MPQYTCLQMKQLFLEFFAISRTGLADPKITHRKRSTFYVIEEGETEEGEYGFWVLDKETGGEGFYRFVYRKRVLGSQCQGFLL